MFLWLIVVGSFVAFLACMGIGGNDLANSFGTTYGAGVLTLKQIAIFGSICEFAGSILLGGEVAKAMANSVTDNSHYKNRPELYQYGMFTSLICTAAWLWVATFYKLPVSTTHSIVGAIIGFGFVVGGGSGVLWSVKSDSFPFVKGVVPIVISWFTSPLLSGIASALFFIVARQTIMRAENAEQRATWSFGIIVWIAVFVNLFFIFSKGMQNRVKWSVEQSAWIAAVIATGCSIICFAISPKLTARIKKQHDVYYQEKKKRLKEEKRKKLEEANKEGKTEDETKKTEEEQKKATTTVNEPIKESEEPVMSNGGTSSSVASPEQLVEVESPAVIQTPAVTSAEEFCGRQKVEQFNSVAETYFKYLQVFSAICLSFAHGANDVSNSIGAYAGIYSVYLEGKIVKETPVEIWMLAFGGAGIVVGLIVMGVKIMEVLGTDMCTMTPVRGFSCEFGASLVVSLASAYGLPVSTTHCISGAVIGIGVSESTGGAVSWGVVGRICIGWVATIVITSLSNAALFSWGIYAPTVCKNNVCE